MSRVGREPRERGVSPERRSTKVAGSMNYGFVVEAFDELARAGRDGIRHEQVHTAVEQVRQNDRSTSHCSPIASWSAGARAHEHEWAGRRFTIWRSSTGTTVPTHRYTGPWCSATRRWSGGWGISPG